MTYVSVEGQWL